MSTTELTFNQMAEVPTRELSQQRQPVGLDANRKAARDGGSVAGNAWKDLEQQLGRSVITSQNAAELNHVIAQMIEASAATTKNESGPSSERESAANGNR